jgi:hypothetical protein
VLDWIPPSHYGIFAPVFSITKRFCVIIQPDNRETYLGDPASTRLMKSRSLLFLRRRTQ